MVLPVDGAPTLLWSLCALLILSTLTGTDSLVLTSSDPTNHVEVSVLSVVAGPPAVRTF